MNKKIFGVLYILAIIIALFLVLYFSLKDNYDEIISMIANIGFGFLIIGIILFLIYRFLVGYSIYILVKNSGDKISLFKGFQLSLIILFFNAVTPFASGGQPMSIYYLHKEDMGIAKATNIVLQNFIMYQTSLILVGGITLIYNFLNPLFVFEGLMKRFVILGFLINFSIWIVTFLLAFGKKSVTGFIEKIIKLLYKLKIIRNLDKYMKKIEDLSNKFYGTAINLKNNKKVLFSAILVNVVGLLSLYSIPFVLAMGLNISNINIWYSIIATSYVMIVGSFVPTPGGTGGIEYGFVYFFKYLIKGSLLSALMLIWRFITYYFGIILGGIVMMFYRKKSNHV